MNRDSYAAPPAPAIGLGPVPAADAPAERGLPSRLRSLWRRFLAAVSAALQARRIARQPSRHASLGVISNRTATPTLLQVQETARIYRFPQPVRGPQ